MAKAREFMMSYSLTNKVWFEAGIEAASKESTNKVTAREIMSFPKVSINTVQSVWQ